MVANVAMYYPEHREFNKKSDIVPIRIWVLKGHLVAWFLWSATMFPQMVIGSIEDRSIEHSLEEHVSNHFFSISVELDATKS